MNTFLLLKTMKNAFFFLQNEIFVCLDFRKSIFLDETQLLLIFDTVLAILQHLSLFLCSYTKLIWILGQTKNGSSL